MLGFKSDSNPFDTSNARLFNFPSKHIRIFASISNNPNNSKGKPTCLASLYYGQCMEGGMGEASLRDGEAWGSWTGIVWHGIIVGEPKNSTCPNFRKFGSLEIPKFGFLLE
jgi:hypothetical protein